MGPVRDVQLVLGADAALAQGIELGEEGLRIERHPVADEADRALDDPRGDLVQHEFAGRRVHGVAGVRPTLVAHDEIRPFGENVNDLPLAFVAPLGADDHDAVRLRSEHRPPAKTPRGGGALEYPPGEARPVEARVQLPHPPGARPPASTAPRYRWTCGRFAWWTSRLA